MSQVSNLPVVSSLNSITSNESEERCGNCIGCLWKNNCGKCDNCNIQVKPCLKRKCVQAGNLLKKKKIEKHGIKNIFN